MKPKLSKLNVVPKFYSLELKERWNDFVEKSEAPFFFSRDFLSYHGDKFVDKSIVVVEDSTIIGIMPIAEIDGKWIAHPGLSFGGLVLHNGIKDSEAQEVWSEIVSFCNKSGVVKLVYKEIPVFHLKRADALARIIRSSDNLIEREEISFCIDLRKEFRPNKTKRRMIRKFVAKQEVNKEIPLNEFYQLLKENLGKKYEVNPLHAISELEYLMKNFPDNIQIIDIVNKRISPRNTTPLIEVLRLGFNPVYFPFTRPESKHKSRWTFKKKVKLATDTFYSSSNFPIKLMIGVGLGLSMVSFLLVILIIAMKLFSDNTLFGFPIAGWATTVTMIAFFNGLILFSLGIIATYIWLIFSEVKGRPDYIIRDEEGNNSR